jgi:transcriptional regulator with PAS, ATPase and Fis domain
MRNDFAPQMIGTSPQIQTLRDQITKIGRTTFSVLIEGETGTGKELVAKHLHAASPRSHGPFIAVNCAALVESLLDAELFGIEKGVATDVGSRIGRLEQAHRGTLFLDEVADLSLGAQAKLLRVLQDFRVERVGGGVRHVDVRILAATNQRLADLVRTGRFRADLFYRLNTIDLTVPPLRHRAADILPLARHFLRLAGLDSASLSADVVSALLAHDWPGNIRELQRAIERTVTFRDGNEIRLVDLPAAVRAEVAWIEPDLQTLDAWASRYAWIVYERCERNKRVACQILDISYPTLCRHLSSLSPSFAQRVPNESPYTPSQTGPSIVCESVSMTSQRRDTYDDQVHSK